jgi:Tfp pilus assembly pilus retraction ATPase PilT
MLLMGYGARQHVRRNALQHLHQEISITRGRGSFTLEDSLAGLVRDGRIERDEALTRAIHPDLLKELLDAPIRE